MRAPLPPLIERNPRLVREKFSRALPQRFTSDDTIVIESPFFAMTVLGVLRVDRPAETFELVALNPLGAELFRLSGAGKQCEIDSAIGPFMKHRKLLLSIGADVRRIYFNLLPPKNAASRIGQTEIRFKNKISYSFGGNPLVLLEKRRKSLLGDAWRVRYFQYGRSGQVLYPRGIVLDNGKFHYRIVIKNRDFQ